MQSISTVVNSSRNGANGTPHASAEKCTDGISRPRTLRIAVADSDPAMHPFYQQVLAGLGHHVCVALTGRQLVEQCRSLHPDLVVTGIKLPELDGVAAAEEICREHPIPIILVPDYDAELAERTLGNPYVLGYLFKPVKEADLAPAISLARWRFDQLQSLHREVADLRQALEDRKLIERAKGMLMKYVGLDEAEAFCRLRKLASDRNRKVVEIAQDIVTAAEVFQQIKQPERAGKSGNGIVQHAGKQEQAPPASARKQARDFAVKLKRHAREKAKPD